MSTSDSSTLIQKSRVEFPRKMQALFRPRRYKILYGGRGSAKSWSVGRALLVMAAERKIRVLCGRETQGESRAPIPSSCPCE